MEAVLEEPFSLSHSPPIPPSLNSSVLNPLKKTRGWQNPVTNPGPSAEIDGLRGAGAEVNLWEGKEENTHPYPLAGPPPCITCSSVKCALSTCSRLDSLPGPGDPAAQNRQKPCSGSASRQAPCFTRLGVHGITWRSCRKVGCAPFPEFLIQQVRSRA